MLKIALCDDAPLLRDKLEELIHQYETENNVQFQFFRFDSGEDLLEKFDSDNTFANLFFMDYFMKELNGVETALHIREAKIPCEIVFVSSYDTYDYLSVSPLDILHKPAQKEAVFNVLDKVLHKGCEKPISISAENKKIPTHKAGRESYQPAASLTLPSYGCNQLIQASNPLLHYNISPR